MLSGSRFSGLAALSAPVELRPAHHPGCRQQEINNLKTELELRHTLAGNSAMAIIQRHSTRAAGSRGVFEGDTTRDRLREIEKPRSGTP